MAACIAAKNLIEVQPLDDDATLDAASPKMMVGGKMVIDPERNKERELAIARRLTASNCPIRIVILGGDHDLTEALRSLAPGIGYLRVSTQAYRDTER